jgi:hypothetical protein
MPECRTVRHPVSPVPEWKKLTMQEQVRAYTVPHFLCPGPDAGIPMPALVCSMPIPSYVLIWSAVTAPANSPLLTKQKIICIISNKRYNEHTEPLFKELLVSRLTDLITSLNLVYFCFCSFRIETWKWHQTEENCAPATLKSPDLSIIITLSLNPN